MPRRYHGNAASIAMLRKMRHDTYNGINIHKISSHKTKEKTNKSKSASGPASGSKNSNEKKSSSEKAEESIQKPKQLPKLAKQAKLPQLLAKKTSLSFIFKKPTLVPALIRAPKKVPRCDLEQLEQQPNPDQIYLLDDLHSFDDEELTCGIDFGPESFHESTFEETLCNNASFGDLGPFCDLLSLSDQVAPLCNNASLGDLGPIGDLGPLDDQGSFSDPETICYRPQDLINDQMPAFNEVPPFNEEPATCNLKPRGDMEAIFKLPYYIIDPKYAQYQEPKAAEKPISDGYPPESSDGQGSSRKAVPNDTFAFMFGHSAKDWELKLFPELYHRMPTLPSYSDIFGQPSYEPHRTAPTAPSQSEGIRSNADGVFTNIPSSMILDQYGIVGLLAAMRATHTHPETTRLVFGEDLTKLGLDLASTDEIYVNFNGPFTTKPPQRKPMQMHQDKASDDDFAYMRKEDQETGAD
ncbi:uncharacterized protein LOC108152289 [Drosophila miranda]|uniref:uncharacterized protein LOC108152289 n=1 Tax=Drosophila miranda TaxID=7229 RepID=UPI0007E86294|nr:uncharacterized protein LOC108152289 [Drosophila miranda]